MLKPQQLRAIRRGFVDALLLATPGAMTVKALVEIVASSFATASTEDQRPSPAQILENARQQIEKALTELSTLELDAQRSEKQLAEVSQKLARARADNDTSLALLHLNKESVQRITDQSLRVRARGWLEGLVVGLLVSLLWHLIQSQLPNLLSQ